MKHKIGVCRGPTCGQFFESDVLRTVRECAKKCGHSVKTTECLGNCSQAPSLIVNGELYQQMDPKSAEELVENLDKKLL